MNDILNLRRPPPLDAIERDAAAIGFSMAAEARTLPARADTPALWRRSLPMCDCVPFLFVLTRAGFACATSPDWEGHHEREGVGVC